LKSGHCRINSQDTALDACRWLLRFGAQVALLGAVLAVEAGPRLRADELPRPEGPVILTVDGAITRTNGTGVAEFDRAMLEQLGLIRLRTWTPWNDGEAEFEGCRRSA